MSEKQVFKNIENVFLYTLKFCAVLGPQMLKNDGEIP